MRATASGGAYSPTRICLISAIARIRDFIAAGRGERALERRGEIIAERTARAKAELEALKDQLKLLARAAEYFRGAQAKGAALAA